jgi:hypothetical protein
MVQGRRASFRKGCNLLKIRPGLLQKRAALVAALPARAEIRATRLQ